MTIETKTYRVKAGDPADIKAAMREFLSAFESFKEANDARLAALEGKEGDDVVLAEKIERINQALGEQKAAIDRAALAAQRPQQGAAALAVDEKKAAFLRYMRAGAAGPRALEEKAVILGGSPDHGYLAPEETERLINAALRDISPIRQIASLREIGSTVYRKPVSQGGLVSGWVAEDAARSETAASAISALDFPTMELYAMPAASQQLLDDTIVDIEQWLASEVQDEFAAQEGAAFVNGDGLTQPKGFLDYTIVPEGTQSFGELGYIATGVAGGFPAAAPTDKLLDLVYAPKSAYRANGRFVMNRSVVGAIRKFKDADNNYIWRPSPEAGAPASLLGYPVTEAEDMPAIGADSHSIAFGDFKRFYLIVDRLGVKVLRDPFSSKPYVLFYTTKRVGGGVQDFEAAKLMKFAAS
ncbi:MAG: phage major capsid protein [Amphiplicatus sp.]